MKQPTPEMFREWVAFVNAEEVGHDILKGFLHAVSSDLSNLEPAATEFFNSLWALRAELSDEANRMAVVQWLESQVGFKKAVEVLSRTKGPAFCLERYVEQSENQLAMAATRQEAISTAMRLLREVHPKHAWRSKVVHAISRYLHVDHEARHKALAMVPQNCAEIVRLVHEMDPVFGSRATRRTSQAVLDIVAQWQRIFGTANTRNSKHKAEHEFIQLMIRANFSAVHKAKPEVIAELMTMPCFEYQFELRHIARLCATAKMTDSSRKLKNSVMSDSLPT